jgi:hypothetical protein
MFGLRHKERVREKPHPIHDSIFGDDDLFGDDSPETEIDDTPPFTSRGLVNAGNIAAAPEGFGPMRQLGDTDQGDRQPLGGRRR